MHAPAIDSQVGTALSRSTLPLELELNDSTLCCSCQHDVAPLKMLQFSRLVQKPKVVETK